MCLFLFSGYDFGYLIKILSNSKLPEEEVDFFEILRLFFPIIYDVKYLMKSCKNLKACTHFVFEMCRYISLESTVGRKKKGIEVVQEVRACQGF